MKIFIPKAIAAFVSMTRGIDGAMAAVEFGGGVAKATIGTVTVWAPCRYKGRPIRVFWRGYFFGTVTVREVNGAEVAYFRVSRKARNKHNYVIEAWEWLAEPPKMPDGMLAIRWGELFKLAQQAIGGKAVAADYAVEV